MLKLTQHSKGLVETAPQQALAPYLRTLKLPCPKPIQARSNSPSICLTKATEAYGGSLPVGRPFFPVSCTSCVHNPVVPSTPSFSLPLPLPCLSLFFSCLFTSPSIKATTSLTATSPHGGDQASLSTNRTPHPSFLHPCVCDMPGLRANLHLVSWE